MADEGKTEETEAAAEEQAVAEDPNRDGVIAALKRERGGYQARGLAGRVAEVDAELERLGAPKERAPSAPRETAVESKPRRTASRAKSAD